MKRRLLLSALIFLSVISLTAFPIVTMVNTFGLPSVYEDSFLGEMKYKINRLKELDDKRIVLVGGSSVPFGVRSDLVEEYLPDYKVVDFGMYASLGSDVMLDFAKARINKDDIVIFMPEQHPQTLSMYYNGEALWQALDGAYQNINLLPKNKKERLIGDMFNFSQNKYKYNFLEKIDLGDSLYQKSSFNEYGDIKAGLTPYNTMQNLYDQTNLITFNENIISDDFINYTNEFNNYVHKKGATLYYYFAPINKLAHVDNSDIDVFYDYLSHKFNFEIIGNPHDSLMDPEWFYDTNYHLNDSGSLVFTKKLIQNIKLLLDDTSPTDIKIPDKPVIPEEESKDGNNIDDDCFIYEAVKNGYVISGIKEIKEQMVIPYRHEGKLIRGFKVEVFQNKNNIKEITIQDNIRYIYDYSFDGCSKLEKIHLINNNPSSINIGVNLLDGTNAFIYVPKELFGKYITNYNFGIYASRIKPEN